MRRLFALLCSFGLLAIPVSSHATAPLRSGETDRAARPIVAIADFPGDDNAVGAFVADTLLTDLSHSVKLQTLERTEVHRALDDLNMRSPDALTAVQVRRLGSHIHASKIVVGTYLVRDGQVVINVRLLDTQSGLNVPGSSFNITGPDKSLLSVTHRVAHQLHRKLTGNDLVLDELSPPSPTSPPSPQFWGDKVTPPSPQFWGDKISPASPTSPPGPSSPPNPQFWGDKISPASPTSPPSPQFWGDKSESPASPQSWGKEDPLDSGKRMGLIPASARPNDTLAERDLTGFVGRLAKRMSSDSVLHLAATAGPVSRMQALTAIVKQLVPHTELASYKSASVRTATPDGARVPLWGQPYLAAAIEEGYWDSAAPFRPRETATWAFVQTVVARLPIPGPSPRLASVQPKPDSIIQNPTSATGDLARPLNAGNAGKEENAPPNELYTGLVVDARDFELKRDHSPRILDETGAEVYPDRKHCPSLDFVDNQGMASYIAGDGESRRAGAHPLVVHAIGTTGPGPFDVIVSNEDARRILEANKRTKFLWKWSVTFAISER